ncbi:hypothetical protein BJ165DRAFT_1477376 [Panaeolus papilionaceus]|nr:hypothetical protein BJ165DRAFT_1477376 [Panaeolus papilionaceus]
MHIDAAQSSTPCLIWLSSTTDLQGKAIEREHDQWLLGFGFLSMSSLDERPQDPTPFFGDPNTPANQQLSGRITAPPTKLDVAVNTVKDTTLVLGDSIKWTTDQIMGIGIRAVAFIQKKIADLQKAPNTAGEGTELPVIPMASTTATESRLLVQREGYEIDKED